MIETEWEDAEISQLINLKKQINELPVAIPTGRF